ncbi:hypothetical protein BDZ94DRAFT_185620 [Collybia nuda]|uniref:Uncharacterized protein n=1 Tax=Collybia nuda TaxID=64659 RepID=A0A9P5YFD7_9AGAR|nr:hypothetical protein BDZ94DRAFT_185620 [Collybia nuda]
MFFLINSAKKVPTPTSLPSNWPSSLHHKCSFPSCYHPNPPQAVAGLYNCCGRARRGFACKGTYIVSQASADQSMRKFHDSLVREETKKQTTQTLQRRAAQRKRIDASRPDSPSPIFRRPRLNLEKMHYDPHHGQVSVQQVPISMARQSPTLGQYFPSPQHNLS